MDKSINKASLLKEKPLSILALDHGLTLQSGSIPVTDIYNILTKCHSYISATIMTYGMTRFIKNQIPNSLPTIIQCFGGQFHHPKVQVCNIEQVLSLNADGVAVQINFDLDSRDLSEQISAITRLVCDSHREKLPVLFMVSSTKKSSVLDILQSIRFCQELGADIIKIGFNQSNFIEEINIKKYNSVLKHSPPVVLAGGEKDDIIFSQMKLAKKLGFSGYCVGRNIYQSNKPHEVAHQFSQIWNNKE